MNSHFKDSLNRVKADKELVYKTEQYLQNKILDKHNHNLIQKILSWKTYKSVINIRKLAISVCIASLLIVGGAKVYAAPQSYVNIDINPSVGLGINLFGLVTNLEAYNEDGYTILEGVDVTGENVMNAVKILVNSAVNHGFVADDGSTVVYITAATNNEDTARGLNARAEAGAQEALKENGKSAEIFKDKVDLANVSMKQYRDVKTKDMMKTKEFKRDKDNNSNSQDLDVGVDNQNDNATVRSQNPSAQNSDAKNGNNNAQGSQEKVKKDNSLQGQNLTHEEDENSEAGNHNANSNAEKGNENSD